jgi:RecA-family ATPase
VSRRSHEPPPSPEAGAEAAGEAEEEDDEADDVGEDADEGADEDRNDDSGTEDTAERAFRDYTAENDRPHEHGNKVAEWIYQWLDRTPYLRVERKQSPNDPSKKWYPQSHLKNGVWCKGEPKGPRIPYRLPELVEAARHSGDVHIGEGEAVSEALRSLGLVASTNSGGAGKWWGELTRWFAGFKRAFIHEDNDEPGREHAKLVATALAAVIPEIRIIRYTELREKGDVKDWIEQGHTREELLARCEAAPAESGIRLINIRTWDGKQVPPQEWSVPERFPLRQTALLSGEGSQGKDYIMLQLAIAQATGREWLDVAVPQGPTLYIDTEDDGDVLHRRADAIAQHYDVTFAELADRGLNLSSWFGEDAVLGAPARRNGIIEPTARYRQLLEMAGDLKPKTISISSASNVFAGSEIDRAQVRQFINLLSRIAVAANGTVVLITHPSLTGISSGTGLSGSTQWHNGPRARAVMSSVNQKDGVAGEGLKKIEFHKNQYGTIQATIFVRFENGLFMPVAGASTANEAERMQRAEDLYLTFLERFTTQNQILFPKRGPNCAATKFAEQPEAVAAGLKFRDFNTAQQRLLDAGKVAIVPFGSPSRQATKLVIVRPGGQGLGPTIYPTIWLRSGKLGGVYELLRAYREIVARRGYDLPYRLGRSVNFRS